jgi:eukaryotic-like serine/threonine-protein kinase
VSTSPIIVSGEFASRYTVERELGRGATSVVYLARDLDYGRMVAIKVLRDELSTGLAADRFLREIRVTAQLHHPNILPVLHSGEDVGRLFFVLPFMDGGTLRDRLQREKQLPVAEVVAIGVTVANALASAHEKNVLHRDVKPENILFTGGQACLADFGIARAITRASDDSTTTTGLIRGTPAYMSPEQASGEQEYDGRSDLYALACVLYEALAGVPAFVGPTPQSVIAQRMVHEARPISVYRPSVAPELESVLMRALQRSAADRFQTAREFADALTLVPIAPTREQTARTSRAWSKRAKLVTTLSIVTVVLALAAWRLRITDRLSFEGAALDTLRVAILPFDDSLALDVGASDLLYESIRRWKGISPVESFTISDAVRRYGLPTTTEAGASIARRVGAGRFIRGRVTRTPGQIRIVAALVDTRTRQTVYDTVVAAPNDSSRALSPYDLLSDLLALRGARVDGGVVSRNLPAVQAMLRAASSLSVWDLPAAESLYARALQLDPTSNRAAFWTAQVRAWRSPAIDSWRSVALQAVRDTTGLAGQEQGLAMALAAIAAADYERGCRLYDSLTRVSPRSFPAWFGLGQCIDLDRRVVPDARVPSGWRFRSSYQRAIDAYLRAFETLPSAYRGYEGAAYSSLLKMLFVSGRARRQGSSEGTPLRVFIGTPVLDADTLAFVVQPLAAVSSGTSIEDRQRSAQAVTRMRQVFRRITAAWAVAFPGSPGTKEGLAISLELVGDPAAIDTLRSSIRLATDPQQRLQLLTKLVWLEIKFGFPNRIDLLRDARRIADSVLAAPHATGRETWELLSRLAAVTGRCTLASELARRSADARLSPFGMSRNVVASINARTAFVALGCAIPDSIPSLERLSESAELKALPANVRAGAESWLFGLEVRMADSLNVAWARRLAPSADYLITTRLALADGRPDLARKQLENIAERRSTKLRGDISPDAIVPETRVWLSLGDSVAARAWLDGMLRDAAFLPPMSDVEFDNLVLIASLIRAAALRGEIATDTRDGGVWARGVLALWDGADPALTPLIRKLQQIARP